MKLRVFTIACVLMIAASASAKPRRPAGRPARHESGAAARSTPTKGAEADTVAAGSSSAPPPSRGPSRIDFDDRLVQGQSNKSGAVYLYDRKELKTRSMIRQPESFREEIIRSLYDE